MSLLKGLLVLDFSQFLAGPSAALRLADLGAEVIKIERPNGGDNSRKLYLQEQSINQNSLLFHTINRNKKSLTFDLKNDVQKQQVYELIKKADVLIENNRPGIMKRLALDYETVKKINPKLIYASVSGYGPIKAWLTKPGQDLLAQSISGLPYLNGNADMPPTPFPLSIADSFAGIHMVEGILAGLIQRHKTNEGSYIEVSLLESVLSIQFEVLTTYFNDGKQSPKRAKKNNAHAYLSAPYGLYNTKEGYIALAMGSLTQLGELLLLPELEQYDKQNLTFSHRDEIKEIISNKLLEKTAKEWIELLSSEGYWCAPTYNWEELRKTSGYKALEMETTLNKDGHQFITTNCPIRVNKQRNINHIPAPNLGEHNDELASLLARGDQYVK